MRIFGTVAVVLALAALIPGCRRHKSHGGAPAAAVAPATSPAPSITVQADGPRVFDPKLEPASLTLRYTLWPQGKTFDATVGVFQGDTEIERLQTLSGIPGAAERTVTWDGRDGQGRSYDPGSYTLRITGTDGSETHVYGYPVAIVRLGVVSVEFTDTDQDTEHDLVYFKRGSLRSSTTITTTAGPQFRSSKSGSEASDLDLDTGTPRPIPAPNPSVESPEMDGTAVRTHSYNRPIAYVQGTTPRCTVVFGGSATSERNGAPVGVGYPSAAFPLRAVAIVDGVEGAPTAAVAPDTPVSVAFPETLPAYVTKGALSVEWAWEYEDAPGAWVRIPGRFGIQHAYYTLVGAPQLRAAGAIYQPWVKVVDTVAGWAGADTTVDTPNEVIALVDQNIFLNFGVAYDSAGGGRSMYTTNPSTGAVTYSLGALLDDRANGTLVNCLDCAATTTTFCNMMGAGSVQLLFIQGVYSLNYIEGIGVGWTAAVFGSGHAFGWHEVSTSDAGASVIDDCLNVDVDGNPSVLDAPNALRGWNINRPWADYAQLSKKSGAMTPYLDSKPILKN